MSETKPVWWQSLCGGKACVVAKPVWWQFVR